MKIKWYDAEVVVPAKPCTVFAMDEDGFHFTTVWKGEEGWRAMSPKYWTFAPSFDDVEFDVEHG